MKFHDDPLWIMIDPADVDIEDATFLIPCFADLQPLVKSIESIGILNAPFLQEGPGGRLRPVIGRRRLKAALIAGLSQTHVRLLPKDMPEQEVFSLAFWDNLTVRPFQPGCRAYVTRRILELFSKEEAAKRFLIHLGIHPSGPRLAELNA
ncbi:MAG: ParB N-terminal domain-containing protein, partial [Pseudomonadota bacterium]